MTRFRDAECSIVKCPFLREDCAVNDVVTVALLLLFVGPPPKQDGHHPEIHEVACMFLPSNNCCLMRKFRGKKSIAITHSVVRRKYCNFLFLFDSFAIHPRFKILSLEFLHFFTRDIYFRRYNVFFFLSELCHNSNKKHYNTFPCKIKRNT